MMGLPVAKSGVWQPQPNELKFDGSSPLWEPLLAPLGLEMVARLSRSNTSNRNCAPKRSLNVKFLNKERSQFLKPLSRKMFRPMLPKVPVVGGTMTELRPTKQPPAARLPKSGLTAEVMHALAIDAGSVVVLLSIADCIVHEAAPMLAAVITPLVGAFGNAQ